MIVNKKNRVKPFFKQLIKLRENVQEKTKLLKFKHKKWEISIERYSNKLKKRYLKFKAKDHTRYTLTKYPNNGTSRKKLYRNSLNSGRNFRLFYGGLLKKDLKKQIKLFNLDKKKKTDVNLIFIKHFEKRLDTILFRSKFAKSFRNARQIITHKKIKVNGSIVNSPSYILENGDLVSIDLSYQNIIIKNLQYCLQGWLKYNARLWPTPPKHLVINYSTMEIFIGDLKLSSLTTEFTFDLKIEKVLLNYYRQ
jgi:small subunit ribosomal protein S4